MHRPTPGAKLAFHERTEHAWCLLLAGTNRHHPTDVIVGLLLGFLIAFMMYRQLFPSWTNCQCYLPMHDQQQRYCVSRSASGAALSIGASGPGAV